MNASDDSRGSLPWTLTAAVLAAVLAACMTILFLGSRTIMSQSGAFVASGGPYAIEHPAPGWAGALPLSIMLGALCVGLHILAANRAKGFKLLGLMWVGLFGSLGWNFLELGFHSDYYGGAVWAWILNGVLFWLMALPVLVVLVASMLPNPPQTVRAIGVLSRSGHAAPKPSALYTVSHIIALAAGIAAGIQVFGALSR